MIEQHLIATDKKMLSTTTILLQDLRSIVPHKKNMNALRNEELESRGVLLVHSQVKIVWDFPFWFSLT